MEKIKVFTCSQTLFGNRFAGFMCEPEVRLPAACRRSQTKFGNEWDLKVLERVKIKEQKGR